MTTSAHPPTLTRSVSLLSLPRGGSTDTSALLALARGGSTDTSALLRLLRLARCKFHCKACMHTVADFLIPRKIHERHRFQFHIFGAAPRPAARQRHHSRSPAPYARSPTFDTFGFAGRMKIQWRNKKGAMEEQKRGNGGTKGTKKAYDQNRPKISIKSYSVQIIHV